jgi:hypothetical protein
VPLDLAIGAMMAPAGMARSVAACRRIRDGIGCDVIWCAGIWCDGASLEVIRDLAQLPPRASSAGRLRPEGDFAEVMND